MRFHRLLFLMMFCALSVAHASAATRIWDGGAGDNLLMTAANWQGDQTPVAGDDLVFPGPGPASILSITNNFPDDTTFASIAFEGDNYRIEGNNRIGISGGVLLAVGVGNAGLECPVALAPPPPGQAATTVTIRVMDATGELFIGGPISGPATTTLRKEGPGSLYLGSLPSSYDGPTVIAGGLVEVNNTQALGSTAGNTSVLEGASLAVDESFAETFEEPLVLAGLGIGPGSGALHAKGPVIWQGPITLTGDTLVAITSEHFPPEFAITGPISGTVGLLRPEDSDPIAFKGTTPNTFAGPLIIPRGSVSLDSPATPVFTHGVIVGDDIGSPGTAYIGIDETTQIAGGVTLRLDGLIYLYNPLTVDGLQGTGDVRLFDDTLTVASPASSDTTFQGNLRDTGAVIKSGLGTWRIVGEPKSYTGPTTVQEGTLVMDSAIVSAVTQTGGILRGRGSVGALTSTSGTIAPGDELQVGTLTSNGALALAATTTIALRVQPGPGGSGPGSNDSLAINGTVSLNGATLQVLAPDVPIAPGSSFTLMTNDGTDAIAGTFADLPDGATFSASGRVFAISYTGGTGNDIVITLTSRQYYLSEGATGAFFDMDLLIANPNAHAASVELRFLTDSDAVVVSTLEVPALSRRTIRVDELPDLAATALSTIVTSTTGLPLIVERTMTWDASGYGAHTEKASDGPAPEWYFAEGAAGFFQTYLLLTNPQDVPNVATVTFMPEHQPAETRTYQMAPHARVTVDTAADPALIDRSFGMAVTFNQPGMAERSMYFGGTPLWTGGHASAGVTAPATSWFLAEGATGPYFETFILLANPGVEAVEATVTYLPDIGTPIAKVHTIGAGARLTLNIEQEDSALANAAVATAISASAPIVVERSQYWPFTPEQWVESHNSAGVTALATTWGLAEGRVGGPAAYQTYILLANPNTTAADVSIQFLRDGQPPVTKSFVVKPTSRLNVSAGPGADVPELVDESFGAIVTSSEPIAVERAMYASTNGQTWTAGTNATATRLP